MQNVQVMIPVWAKGPEFGLQEWPIDKEEQGYMYARKIPLIVSHIPTLFCLEIFLNVLGFVFFTKTPSHIPNILWEVFPSSAGGALPFLWANPDSYQLPLRWPLVLYKERHGVADPCLLSLHQSWLCRPLP